MNRSEKIKYLESLLAGELNVIQEETKFIWFKPDGIHCGKTISAKDGILITKEQFLKIHGKHDLIYISGVPMPDIEFKTVVKQFV